MATPSEVALHPGFPIIKLANRRAQMGVTLHLRPVEAKKNPRGYEEKLFLGLTNYDATHRTPNVYLSHALDGPTFRLLAHVILTGTFVEAVTSGTLGPDPITRIVETPLPDGHAAHFYQWREFKGSAAKDGTMVSRVLTLTWNDTPHHAYPWGVSLSSGPGRASATGAVMPMGTPMTKVQMQLSPVQMQQWMLLGVEALQ
ncbi:MAG: hypothetical protein C7B46_20490, partial [Sulfobacillus benefaciens]